MSTRSKHICERPRCARLDRLRSHFTCLAAIVVLMLSSPATADVLEISAGVVSIRTGAGEAVWEAVEKQPAESSSPVTLRPVPAYGLTKPGMAGVPPPFLAMLQRAADTANISPKLLAALVWQESRWNPRAVSPKGAVGLAQLMPGTARDLGVDPHDPAQNLMGGARYLRYLLNEFDGDVVKALAGYNAGPGRVRRFNGVPPIRETQTYVSAIVHRLSTLSGGM